MTKAEVKDAIKEQIFWDDRVNSSDINVEIMDGTVKLTGEVPDYSSKVAAEEDAFSVNGVYKIDNQINVKYPPAISAPSDVSIKSSIEDTLANDYRIDASRIEVSINNGTVTLDGSVDAYWKKDVVERHAHNILGVVSLVDNLTVSPAKLKTDYEIETEIKKAFKRDSTINADAIEVKSSNGIVTLTGTVPDYPAKMAAKRIATFTTGVIDVVDETIIVVR